MGNEKKLVVNPLKKYFLTKSRSGAKWMVKGEPRTPTAATGWDLQVVRHNQVLLIEAKYLSRSFISSFAGLVISPLPNRPEKMKSKKRKSWSSVVCWAIGSGYKKRNIYQVIFDYFARNIKFWLVYSKVLKVKYIFFVFDKKVAQVSFEQMLKRSMSYKKEVVSRGIDVYGRKDYKVKREIADSLMNNLKFK